MRKLIITAVLCVVGSSAYAGSYNPALEDPVVTPPAECRIFWGLFRCSDNVGVHSPSSSPVQPLTGPADGDDDDPYCEVPDEGNDKPSDKPRGKDKPKSNASEHNGKGGNDGKGGKERDGSKNSDKGKDK